MPYNGSGTFNLYTPGNPVISGTVISSTAFNATTADVASGLTNAITRDGQSPPSVDLPMAGKKLAGLGAGITSGDSLRWEQLFSQGLAQDIASAATTNIGAQNTTALRVTGTTTITSFGTVYNGPRFLVFAGSLLLTHNAVTLILPGNANITTGAGDTAIVVPNAAAPNGWRVVSYQVAALAPGAAATAAALAGVLAISQGGTGQTTALTAFDALKQASTDTYQGVVELATNAEATAGTDTTRAVTPSTLRAGVNAVGTAPIYVARAWVNFNGVGVIGIRESGNVTSVSDNGIGNYTVNFTTALPDSNYAVGYTVDCDSDNINQFQVTAAPRTIYLQQDLQTTTTSRVFAGANSATTPGLIDFRSVRLIYFR